jgi:adenylate cyclase
MAQLIVTRTGSHLWSKSWDRALTTENIFAIQDEIAAAIATATGGYYGVIRQQALTTAKRKPPKDLSSYECVLLGVENSRNLSLKTHRAARDCLERAVKVDVEYAAAWSALAIVYLNEDRYGYDPHPGSLDRALEAAQKAVELSPNRPGIRVSLALVHFFRGERDAFKAAAEHAVNGSSRSSISLGSIGLFLCYAGEWDRGLALIEEAKRFDPFFPAWYHNGAFHNHYRKRNYQAALESALSGNLPEFVQSQSQIVAAYGQLGRVDEALPHVTRIRELDPSFEATAREHWWKRFRFQEDHLDHLIDGMRKGGLKIPVEKS